MKITKVIIEFDNGDVQSLEGEQAEKWNLACQGQATLAYAHGMHFPSLDWKKEKKEQE